MIISLKDSSYTVIADEGALFCFITMTRQSTMSFRVFMVDGMNKKYKM